MEGTRPVQITREWPRYHEEYEDPIVIPCAAPNCFIRWRGIRFAQIIGIDRRFFLGPQQTLCMAVGMILEVFDGSLLNLLWFATGTVFFDQSKIAFYINGSFNIVFEEPDMQHLKTERLLCGWQVALAKIRADMSRLFQAFKFQATTWQQPLHTVDCSHSEASEATANPTRFETF